MSKATVTRLFIGSGIAIMAGAVLGVVSMGLAVANGVFEIIGGDIVGIHESPLALSLLGFGIVGGLAIVFGLLGGLVSWIGALLNTWRLESRAWFAVMLLLGIFNLGFFAMLAYLLAGPDGTPSPLRHGAPSPAGA